MKITDITPDEYAPYQSAYINLVDPTYSLTEELEVSVHNLIHFVREIPMDKYDYRYAEGKWTIKDIIQHLIDTERIFVYRALRFARADETELPGFDETSYGNVAHGDARSINDLLTEMSALRHATIMMFKSFNEDDLSKKGTASGYTVSVRAFGFLLIGHQNHHIKIFKERYL
ncbi:DinB family protein [Flavobacterium sp. DG1-102-2]|uniref:DinB family protein n=1 Tax=Flavobacterium sp. DG1-102-2 TaxID=3081663 RepID=UPI0029499C82|nr:DinB family protein [Flavobacterium sp. DG1-102-2]MDV6167277.1 DinB family protein [Flavobacterium sp. DG1-102-2]